MSVVLLQPTRLRNSAQELVPTPAWTMTTVDLVAMSVLGQQFACQALAQTSAPFPKLLAASIAWILKPTRTTAGRAGFNAQMDVQMVSATGIVLVRICRAIQMVLPAAMFSVIMSIASRCQMDPFAHLFRRVLFFYYIRYGLSVNRSITLSLSIFIISPEQIKTIVSPNMISL
jgi:hypothetical protein